MRQLGLAVICALVFPVRAAWAQEPAPGDLLDRATQYVREYQDALAGVVSEETYRQTWRRDRRVDSRTLKSDVLLTRPPGSSRYVQFRDVFEVDGRQVRDRDERLLQLFLEPSPVTSRQVLRILDESTRHNLGDISRNVNNPALALVFLDPQHRDRFRFSLSDDAVPATVRDTAPEDDDGPSARFRAPGDIVVIGYEETGRDTMLGTGDGGSLRASGRYWVEPATGRLVMSEVVLTAPSVVATVDVRYEMEPEVGLMVPVAMRERYQALRKNSLVEGAAVYSRVRRFQVTSTEAIADPAQP